MANSKYHSQLLTGTWQLKRAKILKRDNHKCKRCGGSKFLQVHHKYYIGGNTPWNYPDDALETLCKACHKKEHEAKKIKDFTKNKANKTGKQIKKESNHNPIQAAKNEKFTTKDFVKDRIKNKVAKADQKAIALREQRRKESSYYISP